MDDVWLTRFLLAAAWMNALRRILHDFYGVWDLIGVTCVLTKGFARILNACC